MTKKSLDNFFSSLAAARTEEEVKFAYAKYFDLDYDTSHGYDLYTKQVFFEFKSNKNLHNLKILDRHVERSRYKGICLHQNPDRGYLKIRYPRL